MSADIHTFRAVDLETNGLDVDTCEVGQVAIETAGCVDGRPVATSRSDMVYCAVKSMPLAATKVNGLTVEGLSEHKPFGYKVRALVGAMTEPNICVVTFNGARFDIPVIARYAAAHSGLASLIADVEGESLRERFEILLSARHVDVARLWQIARARKLSSTWDGLGDYGSWLPTLHARMFAGTLEGAHGFWEGCHFDGAHDAGVDNRATLAVLNSMLREGFVMLDQALSITARPLPGDVDFDGAFKWEGDQAICSLKKCRDIPIEKVDRGFLQWMLDKDFHRHTKQIVREFLAGHYPERDYENES